MGFALIMGILFADGVLLLALRKNAANDALEVDLLLMKTTGHLVDFELVLFLVVKLMVIALVAMYSSIQL